MQKSVILTSVITLVICASSGKAAGAEQPIAKVLADRYHDKTLYLRHTFTSSSQIYDAEGQPLTVGEEGTWTLYGRISVSKIALGSDALRVEGNRVLYEFSDREKRFMPFRNRERVKIEIRLNSPLTSEDQATAVLARVFALTQEDILQAAPQYWRAYLKGLVPQTPEAAGGGQRQVPSETQAVVGAGYGGVFRIGDPGVTPPKAIYDPEPEFTNIARQNRFQGTVGLNIIIDSKGGVRNLSIARPLGMGLDESAVETVRQWRFTPATKDGSPVAVQVYVQVDYHLGP